MFQNVVQEFMIFMEIQDIYEHFILNFEWSVKVILQLMINIIENQSSYAETVELLFYYVIL